MFVNVGVSSEGFIGQTSNNNSELNVTLVSREERMRSTDEVGAEIKAKASQIPGVKVRVNPIGSSELRIKLQFRSRSAVQSYDEVRAAAQSLADAIKTIPGTADVRLSSEEGKPETRIDIDRQKLAALGISLSDVGGSLRIALNGDNDSKYAKGMMNMTCGLSSMNLIARRHRMSEA